MDLIVKIACELLATNQDRACCNGQHGKLQQETPYKHDVMGSMVSYNMRHIRETLRDDQNTPSGYLDDVTKKLRLCKHHNDYPNDFAS